MCKSRVLPRVHALAAFLVGFSVLSATAALPGYTFTTFDVGTNTDTEIWGLNNFGVASGITVDANGTTHGIIVEGGKVSQVDEPNEGPVGIYLYQINNHGQVAGGYNDASGTAHGVVYDIAKKTFTQLPAIYGSPFNYAGGINDSGEVAGNVTTDPTGSSNLVAYYYKKQIYQLFVDPASDQPLYGTVTYSLNASGTLVGFYVDVNSVPHGFSTPGVQGPFTQLDYPKAVDTIAYGINTAGTIAGRYYDGTVRHGFLLSTTGKYTTVDFPGAAQTWITAINDHGDLGGLYEDSDGNYHGFIAKKK